MYVLLRMLAIVVGSEVVLPSIVSELTDGCMGRRRLRYEYSGLGFVLALRASVFSYCFVATLIAFLVWRAIRLYSSKSLGDPLRLAVTHVRCFVLISEISGFGNQWG
jgi:hypothetical protein